MRAKPFLKPMTLGVCLALAPAVLVAQSTGIGAILAPITEALPGIGGTSSTGLLGVTALQEGANGTGIGDVVDLSGFSVVGDQLDNLGTPLLGLDGNGGLLDVGVLDGDGSANAGTDGLGGIALISDNNTGNGGLLAAGVLNEDNTGNADTLAGLAVLSGDDAASGPIGVGILNGDNSGTGDLIGLSALSGTNSGTGGELGISVLNQGEPLAISTSSTDTLTLAGLTSQASTFGSSVPVIDNSGIAVGGGSAYSPTTSNDLINIGALTGDSAGTGGAIGVGVLAGDGSGSGDVAGVCVLCGDSSGSGPLGVGVLSGSSAGTSSDGAIASLAGVGVLSGDDSGTATGLAGAGVLNGDGSGTGGTIGAGVLNGDGSGSGGTVGAGVLNGDDSGNGGTLAVGALNGDGSGNGGTVGAGVLNGDGSGNGGSLAAGVLNGDGSANSGGVAVGAVNGTNSGQGGTVGVGVANGAQTSGRNATASNTESVCTVVVRDDRTGATRSVKVRCDDVLPAVSQGQTRAVKVGDLTFRMQPATPDAGGVPPCTVLVLNGLGEISQAGTAECSIGGQA